MIITIVNHDKISHEVANSYHYIVSKISNKYVIIKHLGPTPNQSPRNYDIKAVNEVAPTKAILQAYSPRESN
jgi:hypothetical protein